MAESNLIRTMSGDRLEYWLQNPNNAYIRPVGRRGHIIAITEALENISLMESVLTGYTFHHTDALGDRITIRRAFDMISVHVVIEYYGLPSSMSIRISVYEYSRFLAAIIMLHGTPLDTMIRSDEVRLHTIKI